jgi:hypothetical protein
MLEQAERARVLPEVELAPSRATFFAELTRAG